LSLYSTVDCDEHILISSHATASERKIHL